MDPNQIPTFKWQKDGNLRDGRLDNVAAVERW